MFDPFVHVILVTAEQKSVNNNYWLMYNDAIIQPRCTMNQTELQRFRNKLEKNPTLFDLLAIRGYDKHDQKLILQHINSGEISMGAVWENALSEFMPFTEKSSLNSMAHDWEDGTDGKFVMTSINDNIKQLKVSLGGIKNKTGTLRVCICSRQDNYKLYFMLIPFHIYSTWPTNTHSPLKLSFNREGKPTGKKWEEYKGLIVPFSLVSAPMTSIVFGNK